MKLSPDWKLLIEAARLHTKGVDSENENSQYTSAAKYFGGKSLSEIVTVVN